MSAEADRANERKARLLAALRDAPDGLTRSDVHRLFHKSLSKHELDGLLGSLAADQLVEVRSGKRPRTVDYPATVITITRKGRDPS